MANSLNNNMRKILIIVFIFLPLLIFCQTPLFDKTWELKPNKSDEFKKYKNVIEFCDSSFNNFWYLGLFGTYNTDSAYLTGRNDYFGSYDPRHNFIIDSDATGNHFLTIVTKKEIPAYNGKYFNGGFSKNVSKRFNYTTGALNSQTNYHYGYFELRFLVPEDPHHSHGFQPAFWLYGQDPSKSITWSELDIIELLACNNWHTCNVHFVDTSNINNRINYHNNDFHNSSAQTYMNFSNNTFHTIGMEWTPRFVRFYIDNVLRRTVTEYASNLIPMQIILNVGSPAACGTTIDPNDIWWRNIDSNTMPVYNFKIDYFRYYQLKNDCSNDVTIDHIVPISYDYRVHKSITISNKDTATNLGTGGGNVIMRFASGGLKILKGKGFHINKGTGWVATPGMCE